MSTDIESLPDDAIHAAHAACWLMAGSNVTLDEALAAALQVRPVVHQYVSNCAEAWVDPIRMQVIANRRVRSPGRLFADRERPRLRLLQGGAK